MKSPAPHSLSAPWRAALCAAVLLSLATGTGCAPYRALELADEPAHMRQNHVAKDGVTVAADVLADPEVVELHCGREVREEGFFAVTVHLEDRGARSVEFLRENFAVVLEDGRRFEPVSPAEVLESARRSPWNVGTVLLAPLVFPVIMAFQNAAEYNFAMARNIAAKSFPAALRLEGGDPPVSRAIFFRETAAEVLTGAQFESAVLQVVADVEGSEPADPTGSLAAPDAGDGPATPVEVGKRVTFTISLTRREL